MIALALLLSAMLLAIAALHVYWGRGGLWPASSEAELARTVVGTGQSRMPSAWACHAVAVLLVVVAAWPWLILAWPEDPIVLTGRIVIAAVFFMRGLAAYSPRWRRSFPAEPFATRDRRLYAPICMVLATGFVALLEREY
ncbi:MAG: DUF3995 domain-containing protein [Enhydrobacter sp.]|nr:MAG: DUF3995 domain-containing protein [Enhydrobacter sp.]